MPASKPTPKPDPSVRREAALAAAVAKVAALPADERTLGKVCDAIGGPLRAFDGVPDGWTAKSVSPAEGL